MDISTATRTITSTVITGHMPHMPQFDTETAIHLLLAACYLALVAAHHAHQ